jgi:hypothetical protein
LIAKRGLKVTGSDLSEAAIKRARNVYAAEKDVDFIVDDILNSKLKESEFDYVFDLGCFHVLSPTDRQIPVFLGGDLFSVWVLSFTISVIAGLYPAWKASRLSPIEALSPNMGVNCSYLLCNVT